MTPKTGTRKRLRASCLCLGRLRNINVVLPPVTTGTLGIMLVTVTVIFVLVSLANQIYTSAALK